MGEVSARNRIGCPGEQLSFVKAKVSESLIEEDEASPLGPPDLFTHLMQVFPVKRDEIAETSRIAGVAGCGWFLAIDPPLNIDRPFLGVLPTEECLIDILSFSSDLNSPGA